MAKNQQKVFLALTALEDFWDKSKEIVFLGPWARLYNRKIDLQQFGGNIISNPLQDEKNYENAFNFISEFTEELYEKVGADLNKIHNRNYSLKFWKIVLGVWLLSYIQALYDRYLSLQEALKRYPDFTTLLLSEECHIIPIDYVNFSELISTDFYNLQLYSQIIKKIGKKYPEKTYNYQKLNIIKIKKSTIFFNSIFNYFLRILCSGKKKIIISLDYLSKKNIIGLILKSKFKLCFFKTKRYENKWSQNQKLRTSLVINNEFKDEFKKIAYELVFTNLPLCYLEGFFEIEKEVKKNPNNPKALLNSSSIWTDEYFKHWAAQLSERKVLLLGAQHGGNYGSIKFHSGEIFEKSISDIYYTWGWRDSEKTRPMPTLKMLGINKYPIKQNLTKFLFTATAYPRYINRFNNWNIYKFEEYLNFQIRFFKNLNLRVNKDLKVRLYVEDYGWDIKKRFADAGLNLKYENWDLNFNKSLQETRLFLCDHLSTTFLQALVLNKPTILFWDKQREKLRPEVILDYQALENIGILYSSPAIAAQFCNNIYDNIEEWWFEEKRQQVVKNFCDKFMLTAKDPIQEWIKELSNL